MVPKNRRVDLQPHEELVGYLVNFLMANNRALARNASHSGRPLGEGGPDHYGVSCGATKHLTREIRQRMQQAIAEQTAATSQSVSQSVSE